MNEHNILMERIEVLTDLLDCYLASVDPSDNFVSTVTTQMIDSLLFQARAIMEAEVKELPKRTS